MGIFKHNVCSADVNPIALNNDTGCRLGDTLALVVKGPLRD